TWGNSAYGQVGDGTNADRTRPRRIQALRDVTCIAAGFFHTVVVRRDGSVWTVGQNDRGQLGDGTRQSRSRAVAATGVSNATRVAAGQFHSLALRADNTVMSWGGNAFGQLGRTMTPRQSPLRDESLGVPDEMEQARRMGYGDAPIPAAIGGLPRIADIGAGEDFSIALAMNHTAWTWGDNLYGEAGDGTWTNRPSPVQVHVPGDVTAVAAG